MKRPGCTGDGPVVRGHHFVMIRGRTRVRVGLEAMWTEHGPGVEVLAAVEVIPFLPDPFGVEVRVTGLEGWILGSPVEEEAAVARQVVAWAKGTGMMCFCREKWRSMGRPLDGPGWIAALRQESWRRTGYWPRT
ncbi:MAG: hypothetical protein K8T20_12015 [Planctomycetes bacterium]|nr:hypothetical protein [Planctomycetota bacterium]